MKELKNTMAMTMWSNLLDNGVVSGKVRKIIKQGRQNSTIVSNQEINPLRRIVLVAEGGIQNHRQDQQ